MSAAKAILEQLLSGKGISRDQSADLLCILAAGEMEPAATGAILTALRSKGETADELAGFATAMRKLAKRPHVAEGARSAIDIVGTGGDGSFSFNLSTGAALLAASCGLRVVKHGNRAISSSCGSADVLEELGLRIPLGDAAAADCAAKTNFTFLFAPAYHPAMAALAPVRRALGIRTIFNMLGPLTNPAQPGYGVIGAFSPAAAETMAAALSKLDITRYFVVHGDNGWDEATPVCPFTLWDVRPDQVTQQRRDPREAAVRPCTAEQLRGGDARTNARALQQALGGEEGALLESLVLGASLALEVTSTDSNPAEAVMHARRCIRDGSAAATLRRIHEFGQQQPLLQPKVGGQAHG